MTFFLENLKNKLLISYNNNKLMKFMGILDFLVYIYKKFQIQIIKSNNIFENYHYNNMCTINMAHLQVLTLFYL